jgi:phospholipid/cholesterol/gamma-HCH transport system substrate-binding protein
MAANSHRTLEIGTGLFVLLGFAALFFLTTQLPNSAIKVAPKKGYHVTAEFDNVADLKVGSPVMIAGVTVGQVETVRFDPKSFKAVVSMRINSEYNQIPDDSDASIQTQGLLGGKYVGLGPGGADTYLKDGSEITFTQSAIVLENLINKLFASMAGRGGDSGSQGAKGSDKGAESDAKAGNKTQEQK